jgi:PRC-barrel domain
MKTMLLITALGLMLAATSGDAGAPVAGVVTLGTTVEITQAIAVGNRASKIVGAAVYNEQDEKIGNIDDLIISPDHSVSFAIVSIGGFLGLGSRLVAIPIEQLREEQGRFILPGATKEALVKLPEFKYAS